ncbi:Hypothetical protein NTJ_01512 [Nesidiocoris tenuis]|uniref:Uncharacterized protein n=1 Tax=Nesidiocoris tenuis TaxID=355587 RepID=A0ABN7A8R8_9HEMI|nr:Hypothetical protein NTJ_01512 [Nesidiocoris tenuis]
MLIHGPITLERRDGVLEQKVRGCVFCVAPEKERKEGWGKETELYFLSPCGCFVNNAGRKWSKSAYRRGEDDLLRELSIGLISGNPAVLWSAFGLAVQAPALYYRVLYGRIVYRELNQMCGWKRGGEERAEETWAPKN